MLPIIKPKLIFVFSSLLAFACNGQSTEDEIDKYIQSCIQEKKSKLIQELHKGYDSLTNRKLKLNLHNHFENYLLENKLLKNPSKEAYIELLRKIEKKKVTSKNILSFFKNLNFPPYEYLISNNALIIDQECIAAAYRDVKLFNENNWRYKYIAGIEDVRMNGSNGYSKDFKKLLKPIPPEEFNKDFYRNFTVSIVFMLLEPK